jgi:NAD(P)-dependent dehydrogenase (short-subunit alcohol dehydrogenase family)
MPFDFSHKRVIVTGGSRGIGRAIARAFAGGGARVSICARGTEALAATKAELEKAAGIAHAAPCDLAKADDIARYVAAAASALDGIDILVNNATGFFESDPWAGCLDVDLLAAVRTSEAALPFLERSGEGAIVNIASISGLKPSTAIPAYAAAKAALMQYTTSQALILAPKGIRVNGVAPGSIEFPGAYWETVKETDRPTYDRVVAGIPFGRMGTPEAIADAVLFLASPHARWITGHILVVDGGQSLRG